MIFRNQPAPPVHDIDFDEMSRTIDERVRVPALPTAADIGRLSAEAVMEQYEQAAKAVESMREAVKDRAYKLESQLAITDDDLKQIETTAEMIREKGKATYAQIEEAGNLSQTVRAACAEFNKIFGAA